MAERYHRVPSGEGKLYLCALEDVCIRTARRILDKRRGEVLAGDVRAGERCAVTPTRKYRRAFLPWLPVPVRWFVETLRHHGLTESMGRAVRARTTRDAIVLLVAAEKRPGPAAVGYRPRALARNHDLDRADYTVAPFRPQNAATAPRSTSTGHLGLRHKQAGILGGEMKTS